jgi:hypothetical protein
VGDDSDIADGLAQNCVFLDLPESMAGRRGEVFLFPRLLRITNLRGLALGFGSKRLMNVCNH